MASRPSYTETLLPAPDIGGECAHLMREARDAGFEVGIHAWDHVLWQDKVATADEQWTRKQMDLARKRFEDIVGEPARIHGAAGWQMNCHAFRLTQQLWFNCSSDTRGNGPFLPVYQGEIVACVQLPTTLPTLDEMIGLDGVNADNVIDNVLKLTRRDAPSGHVFTLHAELEGMKFAPLFEQLLDGWRTQGHELVSLGGYLDSLAFNKLPLHEIATGPIHGRSGSLAMQGRRVLPGR